jgi:hypothetical protein
MKQIFTVEMKNFTEQEQESAKREIYNVATELGFPYCPDAPKIKSAKNGKLYMDWAFYTSLEQAFEDMANVGLDS